MFINMKYFIIVICFILCGLSNSSINAQSKPEPIIKVGINPWIGHQNGNLFSLHFEFEKYFKKYPFLTHGPGVDYLRSNNIVSIFKYNFAIYPFYNLSNKIPYRYLFIGIAPIFCHISRTEMPNRYGPGVSSFIGFQFVIKKRFTIGVDVSFYGFKNLNKDAPESNSKDIYTDGIYSLKFGFIIKTGSSEDRK